MGLLREAIAARRRIDTIPPGWKTIVEWSTEEGLSRPYVGSIIHDEVSSGRWERKDFRTAPDGRLKPFYRPKPREKK